jgi:hypothetical protein
MSSDPWTIATARVALVLYVAALLVLVSGPVARAAGATAGVSPAPPRGDQRRHGDRPAGSHSRNMLRWRAARVLWSAGVLVYLAHVAAAFHLVHGWSHQAALAETARQSRELFGVDAGFGLWFNYLFTAVWAGDAAWWWIDEDAYRRRARWISITVHAFIAFMFFNGAVVFADGLSRWIGLPAVVLIPLVWLRSRRRRAAIP